MGESWWGVWGRVQGLGVMLVRVCPVLSIGCRWQRVPRTPLRRVGVCLLSRIFIQW
jgi:hypothetical protein